jgi:hypothetical protein
MNRTGRNCDGVARAERRPFIHDHDLCLALDHPQHLLDGVQVRWRTDSESTDLFEDYQLAATVNG